MRKLLIVLLIVLAPELQAQLVTSTSRTLTKRDTLSLLATRRWVDSLWQVAQSVVIDSTARLNANRAIDSLLTRAKLRGGNTFQETQYFTGPTFFNNRQVSVDSILLGVVIEFSDGSLLTTAHGDTVGEALFRSQLSAALALKLSSSYPVVYGGITLPFGAGTLRTNGSGVVSVTASDTVTLGTKLAGKASAAHLHAGTDITTGEINWQRLPLAGNITGGILPPSTGQFWKVPKVDGAGNIQWMIDSTGSTTLVPSGVTPGTYTFPAQIGVDIYGRITTASSGSSDGIADTNKLWLTIHDGWVAVGKSDTGVVFKQLNVGPNVVISQSSSAITFGLSAAADTAIARANRFLSSTGVSGGASVPDTLPTITTGSTSGLGNTYITLNGTVDANSSTTTSWFVYGLVSGTYTDSVASSPYSSTGTGSTAVTGSLTGLTPGTLYYYRLTGRNAAGYTRGSQASFTTSSGTAIAHNVTGTGKTESASTADVTVTVGSGSNMRAYWTVNSAQPIDSVKDVTSGVKLTKVAYVAEPGYAANIDAASIYEEQGVTAGSKTFRAYFNTDYGRVPNASFGVTVLNNVGSTGTTATGTGVSGTASITITNSAGQWIVCVAGDDGQGNTYTENSPLVNRWRNTDHVLGYWAVGSTTSTVVSSVSYSIDYAGARWRMVGIVVNP